MRQLSVVFALSWAHLRKDRSALALTFVLPLVFFSVFASVFSAVDGRSNQVLSVALEIQQPGVFTDQVVTNLRENAALTVTEVVDGAEPRSLIRERKVDAAIVLPAEFEDQVDAGETAQVKVLVDSSNPLVAPAVSGHLMQAMIDAAALLSDDDEALTEPLQLIVQDAVGGGEKQASVAFFAAGLGVLFLMLSITNRAGMMLEERESGVLTRMLSTQLTINQFLLGRAAFFTLLGLVQISAMFVWAAWVFGLDLWSHWGAFLVLATLSALAATAFALALNMLCRTREQLTAVATITVLLLAAIGGNLFPRFLMPDWLQELGWFTFNAWAVDGFQQLFWYDADLSSLSRQIVILLVATALLMGIARALAGRWVRQR